MSVDNTSREWHFLSTITLDTTYLYYADEDMSVKVSTGVGRFYQGRLSQNATISRQLPSFVEPKETIDDFELEVDNSDSVVSNLLSSYTFANRSTKVYVGYGDDFANYTLVFDGYIAHPNGIRWDEKAITFTIVNKRLKDRRDLPGEYQYFKLEDYPYIEKKSRGVAVPIVYGDWTVNVGDAISIPAICTDTRTKEFKVAGHKLLSINRVFKNAIQLRMPDESSPQITSTNATTASFILNTTYDATDDIISVHCKGMPSSSGVGATLIEKPARVLQHLFCSYMNLSGADLNLTSFTTACTKTGTEKTRRYINQTISTETLIGELMSEAGIDLPLVNNKYYPIYRELSPVNTPTSYTETDIILTDETSETADFSVERDVDRLYCNKVKTQYNYDPVTAEYVSAYVTQAIADQTDDLTVVERAMDFNWYYQDKDVEARAQRELEMFSEEPDVIQLGLTNRAMNITLGMPISLTYGPYTDRKLQVRQVENDLYNMTTTVKGYDLYLENVGHWAPNTAPAYSAASATEKLSYGWWTDDNGYITTGDANTLGKSKWG